MPRCPLRRADRQDALPSFAQGPFDLPRSPPGRRSLARSRGESRSAEDDPPYDRPNLSKEFLADYYSKGHLAAAASLGMSNALIAVEYLMRRNAAPSAEKLADPSVDLLKLARA